MIGDLMHYQGIPVTETTSGQLANSVEPVVKGYSSLGSYGGFGQSWVSSTNTSEVTGVSFLFNPNGTGQNGVMVARIYTAAGFTGNYYPGTLLVESDYYDMSGMSLNETWYFFSLSGWTPNPSTRYVVTLEAYDSLLQDGFNSNLIISDTTGGFPGNRSSLSTDHSIWGTSSSRDLGFRLYNETIVSEDIVTIVDSDTTVVMLISNVLSTDETNALKVDVSALQPESRTGRQVKEVYIEEVKAVTTNVVVDVLWDATSPKQCLTISGSTDTEWDFREVGPIVNNAGSGKTGDILFSTYGAASGSSYSVLLVMHKKY
ncbi:MAG: hypothetical protein EBV86_02570 [Marivivens sp.]|nr:hypothetical protein [Marivivens sp.]